MRGHKPPPCDANRGQDCKQLRHRSDFTTPLEEGDDLTEWMHRTPYPVTLFDQLKKAHPDVFSALLQAPDDGLMTDGQAALSTSRTP